MRSSKDARHAAIYIYIYLTPVVRINMIREKKGKYSKINLLEPVDLNIYLKLVSPASKIEFPF